MSEDRVEQNGQEAAEVKTCPHCRGAWPASRTHCLACGASLADVPARPPVENPHSGPINWRVLDALSPDRDEGKEAEDALPPKEGKGRWWEFWR
jgi:hypothetical protein